ncbi:uncharacterized protein ZHAS_00012545 [Anopheles sinensis]|uniref:Uncharacterized protein n=1 Tax=Anopheles sinensis TaxID=74873 RepID=A0A084W305_ANOSI|nr:uncharacterized protein ZHAS_00012545 [Anopheles sinensis]
MSANKTTQGGTQWRDGVWSAYLRSGREEDGGVRWKSDDSSVNIPAANQSFQSTRQTEHTYPTQMYGYRCCTDEKENRPAREKGSKSFENRTQEEKEGRASTRGALMFAE